jgi:hypothetical protein
MALGSTQPPAEMSTRNLPGDKGRPARKADKTSPPSVSRLSRKCRKPQHLTTLWASTACYRNSFTFTRTEVGGSEVGWGTVLQAGRLRVGFPMSLDFFNWPNPSGRTMALGSTQPLTETSTRNLPGGKGRPARKADNLTAICEPIV